MGSRAHEGRLRRLALVVVAVLGLTMVGVGTPSADAAKAKRPEVALSAPAKGVVGKAFKVVATVKRGVTGQQVALQRRTGSSWVKVAGRRLPAAGGLKKSVTVTVTPTAAGVQVYRAVLAKKVTRKKTTKGATSGTVRVTVAEPPVVPPAGGPQVTFTPSTSTSNEQTTVTFSGTVADAPAGTEVQVQYSRGRSPGPDAWTTVATVPTTGEASPLSYAGTVTIPVDRVGVVGAPQLNLRAVAAAATSPSKSYLIKTRYDGTYAMYDEDDQIVGNDTFQVIYSDKAWRMRFGTAEARGVTDGWDLVDSAGVRFVATHHEPGRVCEGVGHDGEPICHGSEDEPWIDYVATFDTSSGPRRIEGTATFSGT